MLITGLERDDKKRIPWWQETIATGMVGAVRGLVGGERNRKLNIKIQQSIRW